MDFLVEIFIHRFVDNCCVSLFLLISASEFQGQGNTVQRTDHNMLEEENDRMVDHLSSKVQALKSVLFYMHSLADVVRKWNIDICKLQSYYLKDFNFYGLPNAYPQGMTWILSKEAEKKLTPSDLVNDFCYAGEGGGHKHTTRMTPILDKGLCKHY